MNPRYQLFDHSDKRNVIFVDPIYLEIALNNLLSNALKYTNENELTHLIIQQEKNHISIKIKDRGVGIEKHDIDNIFNRFYQAKSSINRAGGSGIGLAFSKEVIDRHNGTLSVISKIDEGSTFTIQLPVINDKAPPFESEPSSSLSTKISNDKVVFGMANLTILLVEDEVDMREYIKETLQGYHVLEAKNGIEALKILETEKVNYIITDYMMPQMDGYEFVTTLKERKIDIPLLVLSAKADVDSKLEMLRLGIDDYVTKPFMEEELLVRVANGLLNFQSRKVFIEEEKIQPIIENEDDSFIKEVVFFIEEHCEHIEFQLSTVCHEFALSHSSLYRKIKLLTGLSAKSFVTEVRLQKARKLLTENPTLSERELSDRIGFTNSTYFSKLFKERFG